MFVPTWIIMIVLVVNVALPNLELWLVAAERPVLSIQWQQMFLAVMAMVLTLLYNRPENQNVSLGLFFAAVAGACWGAFRLRRYLRKHGFRPRDR